MVLLSSLAMGAVAYGLDQALVVPLEGGGLPARAAAVLLVIAVAAVVYFLLAVLTGAVDRTELKRAIARRRA